jgi:flagellar biogenesis protein FliO
MDSLRPSFAALALALALAMALGTSASALGQVTNAPVIGLPGPVPVALSFVRVLGALALVLAIFLGGLWLFRNWQRLVLAQGAPPKLNVLEVRSLGQRHALYVVAYEQQRLLLAASPTGVTLLTHLPAASGEPEIRAAGAPPPDFATALLQAVTRKS